MPSTSTTPQQLETLKAAAAVLADLSERQGRQAAALMTHRKTGAGMMLNVRSLKTWDALQAVAVVIEHQEETATAVAAAYTPQEA